jgi:hypothetical protein
MEKLEKEKNKNYKSQIVFSWTKFFNFPGSLPVVGGQPPPTVPTLVVITAVMNTTALQGLLSGEYSLAFILTQTSLMIRSFSQWPRMHKY